MEENSEKSLLDMPGHILLKILRDADFPSIQSLLRVNQNLHNFIKNNNIKCPIHKVSIRILRGTIFLNLHLNDIDLPYPNGGNLAMTYENHPDGVMVSQNLHGKIKKQMYRKTRSSLLWNQLSWCFLQHFLTVLKFQKERMESLKVVIEENLAGPNVFPFTTDFNTFITKKLTNLLATKMLRIEFFCESVTEHPNLLIQAMDPEYLRKIVLVNSTNEVCFWVFMDGIEHQWRRLEHLELQDQKLTNLINVELLQCLHLKKLTTPITWIRSHELTALKESFLRDGSPKHFRLQAETPYVDLFLSAELTNALGFAHTDEEDGSFHWFHQRQRAEKILHILMAESLLELKFIDRVEVPAGAVVQIQQ